MTEEKTYRQLQAEETHRKISEAIVNTFLEEGWQAVDYRALQDRTKMSLGAIQRYYPTKDTFQDAFQGAVRDYIAKKVDLSSQDKLEKSWMAAFKDPKFRMVIAYLFSVPARTPEVKEKTLKRIEELEASTGVNMKQLLGESFCKLLEY
ncbi:MAG: hypothetical protein HRU20_21530 [Pseudomonadales bacterium]|nr:hypothetical protein [Pseudomonadales bacterium]